MEDEHAPFQLKGVPGNRDEPFGLTDGQTKIGGRSPTGINKKEERAERFSLSCLDESNRRPHEPTLHEVDIE